MVDHHIFLFAAIVASSGSTWLVIARPLVLTRRPRRVRLLRRWSRNRRSRMRMPMPQRLVCILFFSFSSSSNFVAGIKNTAIKSHLFFVEKVSRLCFPSILCILDRNQVARPHQSGPRPVIQPRPHPSSSRCSEPSMPYKLVRQKFFRINGVCEKNHQVRGNFHAFEV